MIDLKAPWTHSQLTYLHQWQSNPMMHPYTCPHHSDTALLATPNGWRCVGEGLCDYIQDWANFPDHLAGPEEDVEPRTEPAPTATPPEVVGNLYDSAEILRAIEYVRGCAMIRRTNPVTKRAINNVLDHLVATFE